MLRPRIAPGDAVRIRGERWRIVNQSLHDDVSILDVEGCDIANRGVSARFILPFEPLEPSPPPATSRRFATFPRWQRAARTYLAAATPGWTSLRAAARTDLTIIPFQLEPVLAMTRGDGCRFLIADEVGL